MTQKQQRGLFLVAITFLCVPLFLQASALASAWSILPSALAIFVAFVSQSLILSLGSAVLLGAFLFHWSRANSGFLIFSGTFSKTGHYFWTAGTDTTNLQILSFVFFILSMVHIMSESGGLQALVGSLKRWIVGPRSAQFVTALLGCLMFIDDYANTMIVGSSMRKVTDRYKISREKLAFLVDSTSAPVAGIALVSTWIGYEVGLFSEMAQKYSWALDGYGVFLEAIPFRFYCFMMLLFVFVNIAFGIDFGPMKDFQESPVQESGEDQQAPEASVLCATLPLTVLLLSVFGFLWVDGGGLQQESVLSLSSWREVLTASENGILILLVSSVLSCGLAALLALFYSPLKLKELWQVFLKGTQSVALPVVILILAWSLKAVCDDLKTGEFIVQQLVGRVNGQLLPLSIFIVSALTAFSTGTSWGTMAILIPTVTPLALAFSDQEFGVFVALCLAAILDGAIMGDHCSPISDTTIMSSISSECDLLTHVRSQLPYSLFVGVLALLFGYIPAGLQWNLAWTLPMSFVLMILVFSYFKWRPRTARRFG